MKELIEDLRNGHVPNYISAPRTTDLVMNEAADAIERLELEAVAATLRIENDALEITGWKADQAENLENQCALVAQLLAMTAERDDHAQQLRKEQLEVQRLINERDGLTREQIGLALDAARYKWLRDSMESPIVSEGQATDKMVDAGISREAAMEKS